MITQELWAAYEQATRDLLAVMGRYERGEVGETNVMAAQHKAAKYLKQWKRKMGWVERNTSAILAPPAESE